MRDGGGILLLAPVRHCCFGASKRYSRKPDGKCPMRLLGWGICRHAIKKTAIADGFLELILKFVYSKSLSVTPSLILISDILMFSSIPIFITILYGNFTPFTSL
jgi:hypothetical protein